MKKAEPIYLSVVMPMYNSEEFLSEAIQSILDQTYPYFELLLVDDGSTDSTREIAESYSDPRVRVILKEHSGISKTLNHGINCAKYDWIARMDSDDIAYPDRFEKQINFLKKNKDLVAFGGIVSINGKKIMKKNMPHYCWLIVCYIILGIGGIAHPTVIVSKKALQSIGGYDPSLDGREDLDMWLRLSRIGRISNCRECVLFYRKSSAKMSGKPTVKSYLPLYKYAKKISGWISDTEMKEFEDSLTLSWQKNNKYLRILFRLLFFLRMRWF